MITVKYINHIIQSRTQSDYCDLCHFGTFLNTCEAGGFEIRAAVM